MTQAEIKYRLSEISEKTLQNLSDEEVLALLKERNELLAQEAELLKKEKQRKEIEEKEKEEKIRLEAEEKAKEWEVKKETLLAQLEAVNKSITPDQPSEKLLSLIQERKVLEAELEVFSATQKEAIEETPKETMDAPKKKESLPITPKIEIITPVLPKKESIIPDSPLETALEESVVVPVPEPEETEAEQRQEMGLSTDAKITIDHNAPHIETSHISRKGKVSQVGASEEHLTLDSSLAGMEFQRYLSELKTNINSLGTFLQNLPVEAKRNKSFMLQVAAVDPAYAMHYADKDTLKKDETFNVAVAGMNNQRNTGNPLSEMLPEMRTGAVLLAGVKNDFRNVRFIRPEMPEYDEILTIAKKSALEATASLKEAHDLKFLIPPILQKDKAFMAEIEKLVNQK